MSKRRSLGPRYTYFDCPSGDGTSLRFFNFNSSNSDKSVCSICVLDAEVSSMHHEVNLTREQTEALAVLLLRSIYDNPRDEERIPHKVLKILALEQVHYLARRNTEKDNP